VFLARIGSIAEGAAGVLLTRMSNASPGRELRE
jgi:hypothetical protein